MCAVLGGIFDYLRESGCRPFPAGCQRAKPCEQAASGSGLWSTSGFSHMYRHLHRSPIWPQVITEGWSHQGDGERGHKGHGGLV